jgi:DNA repair exonuclease SbcCD ATPase subunit
MGLADKVIKRLEQQADTIAQYRQLDEKRRSQICELERKLGDAERERDKLGADRDETEAKRKLLHEAMTRIVAELSEAAAKYWPDHDPSTIAIATFMGEIERLRAEIETLRKQLANAQREAVNLQKLHDHLRPRLDAAQGQLTRERLNADEQGREIETLRQQLANAQQEASDEFAERQVLQHEASDDYVELERLRAFVEVMRGLLTEEYADQRIIAEALDELDAGTPEPVPVAEPLDPDTRDQELERLYSAIDGDLLAEGISHVCREIGEARKHGADSEPSPVAEPLDAEGGA